MMRRSVAVVLGLIFTLAGGLAALSGGAVMALFGSNGTLTSDPEHLSTPTTALVTTVADIDGTRGFGSIFGTPRLQLSVTDAPHEVFIGIGPAAAVDRYLAGASIEEVSDLSFDPFRLDKTRRNGAATLERPDTQTFWVSRSSKSPAELDWRIADGSYRLVVMKTDGTSGVDLNARLGVTIPHLYGIGTGVLIGGLAGVLSGVVLFLTGLRMPNAKDQYRQTATDRPVGHAHPAGAESRTQPWG